MTFDITYLDALLAGLFSFVSACVLPLVPPYVCFLAGVSCAEWSNDERGVTRSVMLTAVAFVAGFTTVFVLLGATASVIGQTLTEHLDTLVVVAGTLIMIMGLHFLGLLRGGWLFGAKTKGLATKPPGMFGGYLVGLAFAFGWTPCVGPVLSVVLFMAGAKDTMWQGGWLLAAYAVGIGLPFLAAAAFAGPLMRVAAATKHRMWLVERVMGGMLVATGFLFMTGQMSNLAFWLLRLFPALGRIG